MKYIFTYILLITSFVCFGSSFKVIRIVDGDTFEIENGEKVRLIGINTPEISDIYGLEAKEYLSDLILGKIVELKVDEISNDKDRYLRLLRYVLFNGIDINEKMILDGYAFAYLKYNFQKKLSYRKAQIKATSLQHGMWQVKDKHIVKKKLVDKRFTWSNRLYILIPLIILVLLGIYYFKN